MHEKLTVHRPPNPRLWVCGFSLSAGPWQLLGWGSEFTPRKIIVDPSHGTEKIFSQTSCPCCWPFSPDPAEDNDCLHYPWQHVLSQAESLPITRRKSSYITWGLKKIWNWVYSTSSLAGDQNSKKANFLLTLPRSLHIFNGFPKFVLKSYSCSLTLISWWIAHKRWIKLPTSLAH